MKRLWLFVKRLDWIDALVLCDAALGIAASVLMAVCEMASSPYWGFLWGCVAGSTGVFGLMIYDALGQREKRRKELNDAQRYEPPNVYGHARFVDDDRLRDKHFGS